MEKLNGYSMMKAMELKPMNSMSFAVPLAKTHYELHKPIQKKLPSIKDQLFTKINSIGMLSSSTKDKLYSYITSLKDEAVLCHSDYHPENVFITDDKLIVFDWSTATIGNRFSDVAHTNLLLRYGVSPDTKNAIELFITNKVRNMYADKYLKEYITLSKCHKNDIYEWEIPNMAAMLNDFLTEKTALYFLKKIERFVHKIS